MVSILFTNTRTHLLYNKAELCAVLKISSSFYGKQVRVFVNKTRTKRSNTLKRYSI